MSKNTLKLARKRPAKGYVKQVYEPTATEYVEYLNTMVNDVSPEGYIKLAAWADHAHCVLQ